MNVKKWNKKKKEGESNKTNEVNFWLTIYAYFDQRYVIALKSYYYYYYYYLKKRKFIIITITISSVLKITITIILLLLKFIRLKTNRMNAAVCLSVKRREKALSSLYYEETN